MLLPIKQELFDTHKSILITNRYRALTDLYGFSRGAEFGTGVVVVIGSKEAAERGMHQDSDLL